MLTNTSIRGINQAQRSGTAAVSLLRAGDAEMAALVAKLSASEVRHAVTRMVDQAVKDMPESWFFEMEPPELNRAAACILVAEAIGWTREEVEADSGRAQQLEWNRSHGMVLTARGMEWV